MYLVVTVIKFSGIVQTCLGGARKSPMSDGFAIMGLNRFA